MLQEHEGIVSRIRRIHNALCCLRDRDMAQLGLTSAQSAVLGYLNCHAHEKLSPGSIGRHFGLKQSTVSGILRRLTEKGFITLAADPDDARCKTVSVTEKALCCHAQITQRIRQNEQLLSAGMSAAEHAQLLQLLDKLTQNASAAAGLPARPEKEEQRL